MFPEVKRVEHQAGACDMVGVERADTGLRAFGGWEDYITVTRGLQLVLLRPRLGSNAAA